LEEAYLEEVYLEEASLEECGNVINVGMWEKNLEL
jgi:hypothetical protein